MTTTPRTDDTAQIPWAQTETMPRTTLPRAQEHEPTPYAAQPATTSTPATAPALNPPTWTGRKTAIAAALAIGFSSMGAVAAAAALPAGSTQGGGQVQQGFGRGGQLPGAGTGPQGGFGPPGGTQQGGTQGGTTPGGTTPGQQGGSGTMQQAPADPNASTT